MKKALLQRQGPGNSSLDCVQFLLPQSQGAYEVTFEEDTFCYATDVGVNDDGTPSPSLLRLPKALFKNAA